MQANQHCHPPQRLYSALARRRRNLSDYIPTTSLVRKQRDIKDSRGGGGGGGPLGIFWVGMCCPGLQIAPPAFLKKFSAKIDTPF